MKHNYLSRQLFLIINQIGIILYLYVVHSFGMTITSQNGLHLCLITLLFIDAAYISYRNIQNNRTLTHFCFLLILTAWQFLLSLFVDSSLSVSVATLLLPLTLYQTIYFLQSFLFQDTAYKYQRYILMFLRVSYIITSVAFFISRGFFAIAFMIQAMVAVSSILFIIVVHKERVAFVLKSEKRNFLLSTCFVVIPFFCYVALFHNQAEYLDNLGTYLILMLPFVSVHSIVFSSTRTLVLLPPLDKKKRVILIVLGICLFSFLALMFHITLMAIIVLIHNVILIIEVRNLMLYWQASSVPSEYYNFTDQQHFYAYSLAQIKREETLKKEFSNYLHDEILQDLLAIKNLMGKAERPEIQRMIIDTLDNLNISIRSQMKVHHPTLLKSLTFKQNIQNLLESLNKNQRKKVVKFYLECSDNIFLIEPYDTMIYRIITELTMNVLKHSKATEASLQLMQKDGQINLVVKDNGIGFHVTKVDTKKHHGLISIQEQVSLLEGIMEIESSPNTGTQITITMPMKGDESYESFISR